MVRNFFPYCLVYYPTGMEDLKLKTVKLKSMKLENYKGEGTWNFQADFGKVTKISGRNRSGKSSVADGYFDCMTGRLLDGSQPDSVRPHNELGEDINRTPVIREIELEIDGKTTLISKKTEQKWKKPRGGTKEIFDGNKTSYSLDGFESGNQREYESFIKDMASPDVLMMCSNARPFLNTVQKSTSEARKALEGLAGFSTEKFIAENPKYAHIAEITKNHKIGDVLKQLRRDLTAQKKVAGEAKVKLDYERSREVSVDGGIEIAELELAINELKEQIAELDKQESILDEAVKAYDEASNGVLELKFELNDLTRKANEENNRKRRELDDEITDLKYAIDRCVRESEIASTEIDKAKKGIEIYDTKLQGVRDRWREINDMQFDKRDENCQMCGHRLPQEKIDTLVEDFEKRKSSSLEATTEKGNNIKALIDSEKDRIKKLNDGLSELIKEKVDKKEKLLSLEQQLSELPQSIGISDTEEYKTLQSQIAEKETALDAMTNNKEKRAEIKAERQNLLDEISEKKAVILKYQADVEQKEKNVSALEADLREKNQCVADTEQKIDLLKDFSIEKNKSLAEVVNPYFHHFHFRFYDTTQDGGIYETLKLINNKDGVSYFDGLNHGDRILTECDLVCGLQELNGLNMPVWLDDTESLDSDRIPQIEQQLILLEKTKDEKMKVEVI